MRLRLQKKERKRKKPRESHLYEYYKRMEYDLIPTPRSIAIIWCYMVLLNDSQHNEWIDCAGGGFSWDLSRQIYDSSWLGNNMKKWVAHDFWEAGRWMTCKLIYFIENDCLTTIRIRQTTEENQLRWEVWTNLNYSKKILIRFRGYIIVAYGAKMIKFVELEIYNIKYGRHKKISSIRDYWIVYKTITKSIYSN